GFLAWMLDGPASDYTVLLPEAGEPRRAILDTSTKEHSAEPDAHPSDTRPFDRTAYEAEFRTLTEGVVGAGDQDRFLAAAAALPELRATDLDELFPAVDTEAVRAYDETLPEGLF
ncbi:hypothetical protein ABZ885_33055, partial [Kitasatospora sp. NPDC047058]